MATQRVVLAVVHNVTAATRLLDTLPLLAADPRIRVVFTKTGSSAFDEGTAEFLAKHGVTEIPWDEATSQEFDLAVSASYGGDLHRINAPLVVVPHGMGYNKYLETGNRKPETGNRKPVFGLSPEWLVHKGRVVPSALVLSHSEQLDRLRAACPEAVPYALVAGDVCYDRLSASVALRPTYRRAFGMSAGQKLVVLSSTWGSDSLLSAAPQLPRMIAGSLPIDEFRVIVALHPNIWSHHSRWQVLEWLSSCRRHGVHVSQDVDEWRAAIVAADLVIGDHGSVPFYSTALGNPLLLATTPGHTVDPQSPIAHLLATGPRLDLSGDLAAQVRTAIAEHDPGRYAEITALTTSEPGRAAALLRRAFYRILRLPEPPEQAEVVALPLPGRPLTGPDSHQVRIVLDRAGSAVVTRFPAEGIRTGPQAALREAHLAVGVNEPLRRWLETADVILGEEGADADDWIAGTLALMPGCVLAAAPVTDRAWLVGDRTGHRVRVEGDSSTCRVFVSVVYEWLAQGNALDDFPEVWSVSWGAQERPVRARLCLPGR